MHGPVRREPPALRWCLLLLDATSVLVPLHFRETWRQEWEAELRHRWAWLARRRQLSWRNQMNLLRRTSGAASDAVWLRQQFTADLDFFQDLRHGLRLLRRNIGFTSVAVTVLALAIGANVAIFSVADAVLLRTLPYQDPDRIVTLWQNNTHSGLAKTDVSPANFLDWREQARSFEAMAALDPYSFDHVGTGEPEVFYAALVTEGFFRAAGVTALHGRTFTADEYQPGRHRVVVMSHGLWQRRFGGDPRLVGRGLTLDDQPYTVVGILPPECQLRFFDYEGADLWAPKIIGEQEKRARGNTYWNVVARLKPDATLEQARAEMSAIAARLAREHPTPNAGMGATVVSLHEHLFGHVRPALLVLLGAVGLVLLIACANVANLLIARGAARERELAIRAAIGASRARLTRQLLTESLLLAVMGASAGLLLAFWGIRLIVTLIPGDIPHLDQIGLDRRVLSFALTLAGLTALVFGIAPSLQLSTPDLRESMTEAGRTSTAGVGRRRLRAALVVGEIALALVLLVGAGLLVRSFLALLSVDPGFRKENVLALQVFAWDRNTTPERRAAFFKQTLERIEALPGVRSAGAVMAPPFFLKSDLAIDVPFHVAGRSAPPAGQEPSTYLNVITPGYLQVMGVPLRRGRAFTEHDTPTAPPVAIINDTMARLFWPNEDPIGKQITVRFGRASGAPREIVGVVGHVRHGGLDSEPRPEVFVPHGQLPQGSMTYVVRTAADPGGLMQAVKQEIWAVDKQQTFYATGTMEQLIDDSLVGRRFSLLLLGLFAALALLLSAVGLYGVISFLTAQRTHEIGVRLALGATARDIVTLIVGQGFTFVVAGIALGLVGAFALSRFIRSLLFGISAVDIPTFATVSMLLLIVALVASYIPARRATKVDPIVALRYE